MAAPVFRFRAQAALDVRLRDETEAQRELARAQGDRDAARLDLEAAVDAAAQARVAATDASRVAMSVGQLQWYQSWIVRLGHEQDAAAATVSLREAAVSRAVETLVGARRRRESLDRFKTKARNAHAGAGAAAERKLIDELATRRHAAGRGRLGGITSQ